MRKKIVAGNWKMNTTITEGINLAKEIMSSSINLDSNVKVLLFPPFTHLSKIIELTNKNNIFTGAQNCANKVKGAFTGEISPLMLSDMNANYVIIGHSERRAYYNETNDILLEKIKLALENNITPIYCIGENLDQRESNNHFNIVKEQLEKGVFSLNKNDFSKIIIAYEPVWAIGTGVTASPEQAQEIHAYIRNLIVERYNNDISNKTSILYGGSCNPTNAKELFANKDIDGGLIGGAALKADDFIKIINSF